MGRDVIVLSVICLSGPSEMKVPPGVWIARAVGAFYQERSPRPLSVGTAWAPQEHSRAGVRVFLGPWSCI